MIARARAAASTPAGSVPGGVREPLTAEGRERIRAGAPGAAGGDPAHPRPLQGRLLGRLDEEIRAFGDFPSLFLALVGPDGEWEHYGGQLRLVDARREVLEPAIDPPALPRVLRRGESSRGLYLKFPYYKPARLPGGQLPGRARWPG